MLLFRGVFVCGMCLLRVRHVETACVFWVYTAIREEIHILLECTGEHFFSPEKMFVSQFFYSYWSSAQILHMD